MASTFAFRAVDRSGRRISGREIGPNASSATAALESRGLVVLELNEAAAGATWRHGHGRVRKRDVLEISRSMAALLPAGIPLARALGTSASLVEGRAAEVMQDLQHRVERGAGLTQALEFHKDGFGPLYLGLVRAGERSGDLAAAFKRLAEQLEHAASLRNRLLSASLYPLILAVAGAVAVTILLVAVIPKFVDLLEGTGARIPASTATLLAVSDAVRANWLLLAVGAVAGVVAFIYAGSTMEGRRALSRAALALPLVGRLRREALGAGFARLLSILLGGGAPLLTALDDTIESTSDPVARDEAARIRTQIREGVPLHKALAGGTLYPPLLARLVTVGEESGRLQEFLDKAAGMLEERTARMVSRLVALAEPAMIVLFGGLVGFVALALLQAIYGVNGGALR